MNAPISAGILLLMINGSKSASVTQGESKMLMPPTLPENILSKILSPSRRRLRILAASLQDEDHLVVGILFVTVKECEDDFKPKLCL
ncbi:hypothetical protein BZA77DRAFT_324613, partial [Pyronema omphalodes]